MGSNVRIFVGIGLLLALVLSGCQVVDRFTTPEDACISEIGGFVDTFDDPTLCGWAQFDSGGATAEIDDGVMRVSVSNNGQLAWSNPGRQFDNVVMETVAIPVSGPPNNAYGLICRYTDTQNFYVFLISADGYYAIGKYDNQSPEIQYLTGEAPYFYLPSTAIRQGQARNNLLARCVDDELTLFANGELIASVQDSTHTTGDIGVTGGSFELGTVVIEFDDFKATAP